MHNQVQAYINNLKTNLLEYKDKKPHLSWRAIAKHSGVNRYFLSKIVDDNGVASSSKIFDLNQIILLHDFLHSKDDYIESSSAPEQIKPLLNTILIEKADQPEV